jgi:hypothetical protein
VLCRVGERCPVLQTPALIAPEEPFTEYAYFSSCSDSWVEHPGRPVDGAAERLQLGQNSFVVEAASNDGYFLKHVVEPAEAVARFGRRP